MTSDLKTSEPGRFDLRELVTREIRSNWGSRAQGFGASGLGVLVLLVGVYYGFLRFTGPASQSYAEGAALILAGLALVITGLWLQKSVSRFPDLLVISPIRLLFGYREQQKSIEVRWDDPRLRLVLFDRSGVPPPKNGKIARVTFSIIPKGGQRIPIPEAAFTEIMRQAERHVLRIQRQAYDSSVQAWGRVEVITLLASG